MKTLVLALMALVGLASTADAVVVRQRTVIRGGNAFAFAGAGFHGVNAGFSVGRFNSFAFHNNFAFRSRAVFVPSYNSFSYGYGAAAFVQPYAYAAAYVAPACAPAYVAPAYGCAGGQAGFGGQTGGYTEGYQAGVSAAAMSARLDGIERNIAGLSQQLQQFRGAAAAEVKHGLPVYVGK